MNLRSTILLTLLFCAFFAQAQKTGIISGKVINTKDKTPVDFATVAIKSLKDSSVVATGQTEPDGSFTFKTIAPGKYRAVVAYLGLKTSSKDFELVSVKTPVNVGVISMDDDGLNLNTVTVKGTPPAVVVKQDTIEFDAKQVKVRENAVVEDLLQKLPGVEVAKDGSIKAQGETITKVKVDGKEFFGSDPLLATKNLPADMVDKIQVIDELSEQAQFTGIDDGTRNKIINITTKTGMKHGYFGNSTLGYGSDDRYDASLNVNKFNNDQQISFVGQFNNVNKQNFGGGGGQGNGFGGGGGGGRGGFGGGGGGGSTNSSGGITTTNAIGLNIADTYKDGTQIQGSYFFNDATSKSIQNSLTQNLSGTNTSQNTDNTTDKINHRINFMIDTKIDPTLSIKIQPNFSYTNSDGNNVNDYVRNVASTLTEGLQRNATTASSPSFSNNLLLRKSFKRRGRTLSFNVNTNINDNDGTNLNYRLDHITTAGLTRDSLTNQLNKTGSYSINNTTRVVYTEPLNKTLSMEFNYQNGYIASDSQRDVYNYNPVTLEYDLVDNVFSNVYNNRTLTNAAGISFTTTEKKYNWNIGLAAQQTNRVNTNVTTGVVRTQNFINLTPSAQFRYNFSNRKRLFANYRGSTTQPSIDQIQPIKDNTNSQTVYEGNPSLKPSFNNQLRINYNNFNFENGRFFFAGLNLTQTFNSIGTTVIPLANGIQQVGYINVNGVYSGNANANWSVPLLPERKLTLNVSGNVSYSRNVSYITPNLNTPLTKNITNSYSISNGYKLVTNIDKFDLTGGITGSWTNSTYSAQASSNTQYYTINPSFDISYVMPGNFRIATTFEYYKNLGGGNLYNREYTIINPYLSRQFFKNRGTFKFSVNDALNQNTGVSRTTSGTSITDLNYNVLKRYYMLSFTYSLTRIAGKNMNSDVTMPSQGFGGGGGGGRTRM